ncbi:MAG: LTA synthase family protein [Lachnospiraceae bacterium]|nr:LTA synthase family protein [Lachnospiraceae bacterium]
MFSHPFVFLYNTLIITITLAPALFFRRRYFYYTVVSLLWFIIGVVDFILLQFRTTPFTFVDITMIKSAISIWDHYLSIPQLILLGIVVLLAIAGCVVLFRKCRKVERMPFFRVTAALILLLATGIVSTSFGVRFQFLAENFGNLADAYHDYGLPYCFMSSVLNTGIPKPKHYSDEYVQEIIDALENGTLVTSKELADIRDDEPPTVTPAPSPTPTEPPAPPTVTVPPTITEAPVITEPPKTHSDTPNIIFLQLESFFDPTAILGSTFSSDPLPTWHYLLDHYTSGYLTVPSIGAGTANTEFEVITGMNLDFFGPGEYPYKTILQETTCESIGYVLKNLDYTAHAIHNNNGTFYERHKVFSQLGFDTFTSIEYMQNIERTPLDWAKDMVLLEEIAKSLDSTRGHDFIYTISVQGHGSYPTEPLLSNPLIDLTLPDDFSKEQYYQFLYYVNQIHEMDTFVAELIAYLEEFDEDTVLVMYGDHLPGLKLTDEQLDGHSLFQTQYVLWSNFELEKETHNVEAYQLYSYVLDRLDIHEGIINRFHQTQQASDLYLEELEILEYDMLYGEQTSLQGIGPYAATDLRMGVDTVLVTNILAFAESHSTATIPSAQITPGVDGTIVLPENEKEDGEYTVFLIGSGFTPYSVVQVDDENVSTMYVNENVLSSIMPLPDVGTEIRVTQQGNDEQVLSTSNPLIITAEILKSIFPADNPELEGED